jgi:tetratricopeptide (TPR) repeat protein
MRTFTDRRPRASGRASRWIALTLTPLLLSACGQVDKWYYCGYGQKNAQDGRYEVALELLGKCLELKSLSAEQRAFYLQSRAWSYFSLDDFDNALDDQQQSFRLVAPTTRDELINYAAYLRMAGRVQQSLEPLREAEALDERDGHSSMMTQYNLGWSLYELGRYDEAIAAFSRGIPSQPDYPFVYFRRGLAYDRVGRTDEADADFIEFVSFFENEDVVFNERFENELRELSGRYPELGVLLGEAK